MRFKQRTLSMHNVVSHTAELRPVDDLFEVVDPVGEYFKQVLMHNGYYTSGPLVFSSVPGGNEFTIMTTLGNRINIVEDSAESFRFEEHLEMETDFFYRHYDLDEPVPYEDIEGAVAAAGLEIKTIYHVVLKFYGEVMLDLYVDAVAR
ncbi:hypothetical protein [Leifsonia sp. EB34]|uniref:hypothetical protein n=1 Tax=Leifsonia sp. EB34 TaxID=3156303 RepID=UPI003518C9E3